MQFRPLHDRVVVRRIDAEEKIKGGIIIPDTAKEKPQEGEIIAVGPGARDDSGKIQPLDVKAGDRVLSGRLESCRREGAGLRRPPLRALEAPIRQIAENSGVEGSIVVGKINDNTSDTFG